MNLSEAVREIIRLGEATRAYWDRELPVRHPHYPLVRPGEDSGPPPPEEAQVQALLESLSEEQVYALIVLMYVGRGNFSADRLQVAYQFTKEGFPSVHMAIAYLAGEKNVAEYLTDGLEELRKRHIDLDSLKFASTAVGQLTQQ